MNPTTPTSHDLLVLPLASPACKALSRMSAVGMWGWVCTSSPSSLVLVEHPPSTPSNGLRGEVRCSQSRSPGWIFGRPRFFLQQLQWWTCGSKNFAHWLFLSGTSWNLPLVPGSLICLSLGFFYYYYYCFFTLGKLHRLPLYQFPFLNFLL